jgi:hypothetical protein
MRYFILLVFTEFFSAKEHTNGFVIFKTFEGLIDQTKIPFLDRKQ